MKTRGTTLTFAKFFLHITALLLTSPIIAQLSFALQKENSFSNRGKNSVVNITPGNASGVQAAPSIINAFFLSPVKSNEAGAATNITEGSSTSAASSRIYTDNAVISFIPTGFTYPQNPGKDIGISTYPLEQLMLYAEALKVYARRNGYDTSYALLSNMGMLYGKKRFFVINLHTMTVEQSGLVAQGRGSGSSRFDKQYSNAKESHCTSLGRYKIMGRYRGEYGDSYRMAGLDSTNDNAYNRNIVLHSMGCITDEEDMKHVCISEGCPAVSVNFLSYLSKIIDSREKPLLLWIFDSNLEEVVKDIPVHDVDLGEPDSSHHNCSLHHRSD